MIEYPVVAVEFLYIFQPLVFSNVTLVKFAHPLNASLSMLVTLLGIVMLVKLLQSENAYFPILVTLLGMLMLIPFHPENA